MLYNAHTNTHNIEHKLFWEDILCNHYMIPVPQKPTNLSVNSDLLLRIKDMGINISATLEKALITELKRRKLSAGQKKIRKPLRSTTTSLKNTVALVTNFGVFNGTV